MNSFGRLAAAFVKADAYQMQTGCSSTVAAEHGSQYLELRELVVILLDQAPIKTKTWSLKVLEGQRVKGHLPPRDGRHGDERASVRDTLQVPAHRRKLEDHIAGLPTKQKRKQYKRDRDT